MRKITLIGLIVSSLVPLNTWTNYDFSWISKVAEFAQEKILEKARADYLAHERSIANSAAVAIPKIMQNLLSWTNESMKLHSTHEVMLKILNSANRKMVQVDQWINEYSLNRSYFPQYIIRLLTLAEIPEFIQGCLPDCPFFTFRDVYQKVFGRQFGIAHGLPTEFFL